MKKFICFSALLILMLNIGCKSKKENVIHIYPEQVISSNYIGNGVQWSAYPHADTENADWGKLMTDAKWEMNFKRLDDISIAIVNNSEVENQIKLTIPSTKQFKQFLYIDGERKVDENNFPIPIGRNNDRRIN